MISFFYELLNSSHTIENKDISWKDFRKPSAYKNINTSVYLR